MDSELIPLESGELCVAAIATALSYNSKQIVTAQKNDKDVTTVRNWISSDTFPECVQDFVPASYELNCKSLYLDACVIRVYSWTQVLWRTRSAARARAQLVVSFVSARHHLQ